MTDIRRLVRVLVPGRGSAWRVRWATCSIGRGVSRRMRGLSGGLPLETIDIAPGMSLMRVLYRTRFRLGNLIPRLGLLESATRFPSRDINIARGLSLIGSAGPTHLQAFDVAPGWVLRGSPGRPSLTATAWFLDWLGCNCLTGTPCRLSARLFGWIWRDLS
jgi:hypothetical protein